MSTLFNSSRCMEELHWTSQNQRLNMMEKKPEQCLTNIKTTIVYHDLYTDLSCCKPRHHKNHLNNTVNSNQNMAARTQVSTCFYQQQIRFDSWTYWCKICQWSVANSTIMWKVGITYHENIMGVLWTNQHWMIVLVYYTPIAHSSSDKQKNPMI